MSPVFWFGRGMWTAALVVSITSNIYAPESIAWWEVLFFLVTGAIFWYGPYLIKEKSS